MSNSICLIVGLGNPGSEYASTRHNAGFWFVEELAAKHGGQFKPDKKYFGETCQITLNQYEVKLLKPGTFMNRSGQAVIALANFYKIPPEQMLVAHDELDFPPGKSRLKIGGGHGGHNGLRDIIGRLGNNFLRLRIGIGHPGSADQVTPFVLGKPPQSEREQIFNSLEKCLDIIPLLAAGEIQKATQALHSD